MNDLKIPPHGVDIRAGSGLISSLSGATSRLCRVSAIGRRSLLVALGLTLLLLYCANSPPIPWQKGWPARRPTEVVLVTGHGFGGEPTFCVRRLSAAVSFQSDPADPQIGFLPGVQNHCWLQELRPEDFDYLSNNDVQRKDKTVFIKLHKRAELYASYARRPPGGVTAVRVRCLPFVYVIGQPKCGTTDLRHRLSLHPRVASGTVWSDAHWWSRQRFPAPSGDVSDRPSGPVSFREYLDSFELVSHRLVGADCGRTGDGRHRPWTPDSRIITVDGSTSTMWDERSLREARRRPALAAEQYPPLAETTAAGLAALQPTARIVAILREPTDRYVCTWDCTRCTSGPGCRSLVEIRCWYCAQRITVGTSPRASTRCSTISTSEFLRTRSGRRFAPPVRKTCAGRASSTRPCCRRPGDC
ncbi:uncharacterized protein LOC122391414 isoform X3 [Amphibalanus amphitrite]|uniref:uncharacterized protein LOC122391414 isoform X3 n=1 Tax=Amphibalanus amphitrite TaxID=1232801 RepID=UPI001C8FF348|nr:uncharacterized protein LOC122391414 isoform X3 [Amphibalanus amphitrite]